MNVLITGGDGQLASDLAKAFADHRVARLARVQFDVCSPNDIERVFDTIQPDVVINTAAFHKVDECETNPERSFLVNAAAPQRLAAACSARGSLLVHYSSDYVFDGTATEPYPEAASVNPVNVYGASKVAGEMAVRSTTQNHLILRTTGLFGLVGVTTNRGNFVETMIRLGSTRDITRVVVDQVLTPTSTADLAAITLQLVEAGARGTIHATNSGQCSWYEFAAEIFRLAELPGKVEPVPRTEFPTPARRPAFSVLAHDGLRVWGIAEPRHWQEALASYMEQRAGLVAA